MLQLFDSYTSKFITWRVVRYEQEGDTHMLQVIARLQDNSRLDLRDYFSRMADENTLTNGQIPTALCDKGGITLHIGPVFLLRLITHIYPIRTYLSHLSSRISRICRTLSKRGLANRTTKRIKPGYCVIFTYGL